ncbi:hypothetical protein L1987_57950 [Smallanthus sonchifolius]|uniref:Uncharacterized protein n=1 Tax=Smallanthus sonchifolius TaxID=185202 RepID=A0ACB9DDZ8_9ASTR|nr:hypothetical protein L1987_57950 [Smallanthus sonchifolius]
MGRDQSPIGPPPGYPNHQDHPRSYVPESSPPPEAYPPQKQETYPPPQPPEPVPFPPPQPQSYNDVFANSNGGQPHVFKTQGIAIGSQFPTQGWNSGLFDCANDSENAIITAFLPCVTFGQIAEIVDNGQTFMYCLLAALIGIPCIVSCSYRTKIRNRYGLMETPAPDWVTHCFCQWCSLCQEFRELKSRGLDPAIGWQGNMIRNQQMEQYPTMIPPMNQTMM